MKIRIDIVSDIDEDEIVIRCKEITDEIQNAYKSISDVSSSPSPIVFFKGNEEFFIPLENILFFETETENVYAHTADDAYRVKFRLYELEQVLSLDFLRISKSTIVNVRHIVSINRNLTAASQIQFDKTQKSVYASRFYYKALKAKLSERRL